MLFNYFSQKLPCVFQFPKSKHNHTICTMCIFEREHLSTLLFPIWEGHCKLKSVFEPKILAIKIVELNVRLQQ